MSIIMCALSVSLVRDTGVYVDQMYARVCIGALGEKKSHKHACALSTASLAAQPASDISIPPLCAQVQGITRD